MRYAALKERLAKGQTIILDGPTATELRWLYGSALAQSST
jgi:hypothetical protein